MWENLKESSNFVNALYMLTLSVSFAHSLCLPASDIHTHTHTHMHREWVCVEGGSCHKGWGGGWGGSKGVMCDSSHPRVGSVHTCVACLPLRVSPAPTVRPLTSPAIPSTLSPPLVFRFNWSPPSQISLPISKRSPATPRTQAVIVSNASLPTLMLIMFGFLFFFPPLLKGFCVCLFLIVIQSVLFWGMFFFF